MGNTLILTNLKVVSNNPNAVVSSSPSSVNTKVHLIIKYRKNKITSLS